MQSIRYSCQILTKLEISLQIFFENTHIPNLMKTRGSELFYADRQTDRQREMTKLIVAFLANLQTWLKT